MLHVEIKGLTKALADVSGLGKQVRFASAVALTRTAKQVEAKTYDVMRGVFDRPTPFTMRSLRTKHATKTDLVAEVFVKDKEIRSGYSSATILQQHFSGGSRQVKQMEHVLRSKGYMNSGEYLVTASGARLDKYGNISKGQLVQILSQIGVVRAGFDSSPTKSKRSKRNVAKAGQIFWSSGKGSPGTRAHSGRLKFDYSSGDYTGHRQNLPKGAWVRAGRSVKCLLLVVKSVRYRRTINLQTVASQVVSKNFKGNFDKALAEALRTAR